VTALADKRFQKPFKFSGIEMPGKNEQVYQGGAACVDTSTGFVAKAFVSTTLVPIGVFTENQLTTGNGLVHVTLNREVTARWFANSTAGDLVVTADTMKDVYFVDDQTVAKTSGTNTRSVAGRVWKVDAVKGVLVETRP
jgi:hypothetical protein